MNIRWLLIGAFQISNVLVCLWSYSILIGEIAKPSVENQRRLNPNMKEVVRAKVIKLLDVRILYPISDSSCVSPVQVVLNKGRMIVVKNEKDELTPTRLCVCINYRKLNTATREYHFPPPFVVQILER